MGFNPTTLLAVDTETTGLHFHHGAQPFAVPLCDQDGETWYCEWHVDPHTRMVYPNPADRDMLLDLLRDPKLPKWFHNRPFDLWQLSTVGITGIVNTHDILSAARVCNTNELSYGLKDLSLKYADIPKDDEKALHAVTIKARNQGKKRGWYIAPKDWGDGYTKADYWTPRKVNEEWVQCEEYGRRDAIRTLICGVMYSTVALVSRPEYLKTYEKEQALHHIVMKMESRGIGLDLETTVKEREYWRKERDNHYAVMLNILKIDRKKWWGKNYVDFNPNSDQQIRRLLFEPPPVGYGFEPTAYTDTNNPSISWEDIACYDGNPFVRHLLLYRSADKADRDFFGKFAKLAVPDSLNLGGVCLKPQINQTGARTLRLSIQEPPVQCMQNKDTAARSYAPVQVRHVIVPRPGYEWWKYDYSQQEIRIFAWYANCVPILETIKKGGDVNNDNANRLWGNLSENSGANNFSRTACAYALELNSANPSTSALEAWKQLGWDPVKAAKGITQEALLTADQWLRKFDYDIIEAEWAIGHVDKDGEWKGKKNSRTRAKNCFYAKIYGGGVEAVRTMMYCTADEARAALYRFDTVFPEIKTFSYQLIAQARRDLFVKTVYGDIITVDPGYEYKGVNYIVQATAAGMMKEFMIRVENYINRIRRWRELDAHQVLSVHDELDLEVWKAHAFPWFIRGVKLLGEDMERYLPGVKMVVEVEKITTSWNESVKVRV